MIHHLIRVPFYATLELCHLTLENFRVLLKALIAFVLAFIIVGKWYFQWIGLGILSSIGLGFGMHTFVLFLAPHIASVTLAAQSCKSLDFPSPPYPDRIICPTPDSSTTTRTTTSEIDNIDEIGAFIILQKVAVECFMWGLGTAIGELPPYFAAKFQAQTAASSSDVSLKGWQKVISDAITKVGFAGILLCASIPNPLFDAAGIASGTAQMPFLTFFGATFIGKAIIKMLIQTTFVIFLFNGKHLEVTVERFAPVNVRDSVIEFLDNQRNNVLTRRLDQPDESWIGWTFAKLVSLIIFLFVISVLKTLSDRYVERQTKKSN